MGTVWYDNHHRRHRVKLRKLKVKMVTRTIGAVAIATGLIAIAGFGITPMTLQAGVVIWALAGVPITLMAIAVQR